MILYYRQNIVANRVSDFNLLDANKDGIKTTLYYCSQITLKQYNSDMRLIATVVN